MRIQLILIMMILIVGGCLEGNNRPENEGEINREETAENEGERERTNETEETESGTIVSRIIDGDTIEMDDGSIVRLLCVNTAESGKPWYQEGKDFLENTLLNETVILMNETEEDDTDSFGRMLRWVYLRNDTEISINQVLVSGGLAFVDYCENSKKEELLERENQAREMGVGLWEKSIYYNQINITSLAYNPDGSDRDNMNGENLTFHNDGNETINLTGWIIQDRAGHSYEFLEYIVEPEVGFTIYCGNGEDNQTEVYWGSNSPIWNNDGDRMTLRDIDGYLVNEFKYGTEYESGAEIG